MKLPEIKSKGTLADRTYLALKNAIIDLEIKPGQLITEEEISGQLGVSRTPIREALSRLQYDGLINVIPGKGTIVSEITEKQVNDLLDVRELLEGFSIQLATDMRTEEDLENIRYMLYRQEEAFLGRYKSKKLFLDIDFDFHKYIASISKNEYLEKQLTNILINSRRILNATTIESYFKEVMEEHKKIYNCLEIKDSEKAKEYMKIHIDRIKFRMLENIKK